jgi:cobalt-zinc-cadmium efflux system membrane fusion protein
MWALQLRPSQRTLVVVLLLYFVLASIALAHEGHPAIPTTGATVHGDELLLSKRARKAIGLTTAKVTLADMPTYVRANGTITVPWRQHAYVTTLMSGVVDDVLVRPGDELQQGQVLARISSLDLEQLQLDLLQADSDFSYLNELYSQHKQLANVGAVSGRKLLETTQRRDEAASRLQVASTKLKALRFDSDAIQRIRSTGAPISQIEIRSPIHGRLVHADIRVGQSVDPKEHLFHVVDNSIVWCVADVLETDSAAVKIGQQVSVDVAALERATRQGQVDHIDVSVDPRKRAVQVVVELENKDLKLRPGMSARIAVRIAESEQAIVCERASLLGFGEEQFVLLKRGEGKFLRRRVELGRIGKQHVEVVDGVFPGDQVISTGTHLLGSLFHQPVQQQADKAGSKVASQTNHPRPLAATGVVELPTTSKFFATSRIGGRIARIFVEHAQPIKKGDPLAEIESMELFDLQLELFQRDLERRWTERTIKTLEPLSQTGGVPKSETKQLKNELRKLEHQVATLTRRLVAYGLESDQIARMLAADVTKTELADLVSRTITIRAPHDGLIADFDLAPGRMIDPHDHQLFEIHDPSQVWIKAYVLEHQATAIATGQLAEVRFAADPTVRLSGRVARIAPVSAESQRVFPVWIELDHSPGSLREGMLTRVLIHGREIRAVTASRQERATSSSIGETE